MAKTVKLKELGELGLDEINPLHIQEGYLRQVAHSKPMTASKKSKSDVRATGAKWYKQKGTGRSRQGETTNPHLTGGGLAFPPKPRRPRKRLNKHVRRSALYGALLWHIQGGSAHVVQGQDFLEITKTKSVDALLQKITGYETLCLIVPADAPVWRAARNLWNVRLTTPGSLNIRDLVESAHVVMAQSALDGLKALLSAVLVDQEAEVETGDAAAKERAAPKPADDDAGGGE